MGPVIPVAHTTSKLLHLRLSPNHHPFLITPYFLSHCR